MSCSSTVTYACRLELYLLLAEPAVAVAVQVVEQYGNSRRWSEIAKPIPGRTGKQCRERYVNHMK